MSAAETETRVPYVGQRIPRIEDPKLLRGAGTFVDDVSLPGMLHAAFVRSPVARAAVTSIDLGGAADQPGVGGVFTLEDLAAV